MNHFAECVSLFLTIPTIILAAIVIYLWGPKAVRTAIKRHPAQSADWFIIGVTIGFVGQFLDNLYWAVPWSLSFIKSEYTDFFMFSGVWFNIPSRQLCGIIAAYCHIKSYLIHVSGESKQATNIKALNIVSFILGAMYIVCLLLIRG